MVTEADGTWIPCWNFAKCETRVWRNNKHKPHPETVGCLFVGQVCPNLKDEFAAAGGDRKTWEEVFK